MAIQFKEIRQYLARNARLSICFEDGFYHDYLMISDIPPEKYSDLYVFGVGMIDVEFSKDIYAQLNDQDGVITSVKDDVIEPAIEVVLHETPRDIDRKEGNGLLFKDLKPYLQIGRNYAIVNREDWTYKHYEFRNDIPDNYDDMFVYGIGMENNPDETDVRIKEIIRNAKYDSCMNKRMVIVVSKTARADINMVNHESVSAELGKEPTKGKGPFFLLVTADEWNHDDDRWLGIYVNKKDAKEAYDRAVSWWDEEKQHMKYSTPQRVAMFEYIVVDDGFREVNRSELD